MSLSLDIRRICESLIHDRLNKRKGFRSHQSWQCDRWFVGWENMLDVTRLDDGFPVTGEMPMQVFRYSGV